MTFIRSINDRAGRFASRQAVKPMSKREIINIVRKRRYMLGKSAQEMADEIGSMTAQTVRDVILGKDFSDATAARLVTWIKRPIPTAGLLPNRGKGQSQDSQRSRMMRRVIALIVLGKQYGIAGKSNESLKSLSTGELRAYYWNLDQWVKRKICARYDAKLSYLLPDHHEAWEWIERLERLSGHPETSSITTATPTGRKIG